MGERPPACEAWQEDLAAWLVAQISPEREAALREHLRGCATCRAEAGSLHDVAAVSLAVDAAGADATPPAPAPADLGQRIAAAFAAERRSRRRMRAAAVGVAVGAVAAVALVVVILTGADDDPVLDGDEIAVTVLPPGATASVVVAPDTGGSTVELVATGFDPSVTYALWLSPTDGSWEDRVPAGTFRPDADGDVAVRLASPMPTEEAGRVWATTPDGEIALDTR